MADMAVLNCPRCGTPARDTDRYCSLCGAPMGAMPPQPTSGHDPVQAVSQMGPTDWMAVVSFPVGLLGLITSCSLYGPMLGLPAAILGFMGRQSVRFAAFAKAGLILGVGACILSVLLWVGLFAFIWTGPNFLPGALPPLNGQPQQLEEATFEAMSRFEPLSGDLADGQEIYIRDEPGSEPRLWVRVIDVLSTKGEPVLFIEWVETGEREVMTQRKFYKTPAAVTGMLYRPREP